MSRDILSCASCRFWQRLDPESEGWAADRNYDVQDDETGICRRLPPIGQRLDGPREGSDSLDVAMWAQWPVTVGDEDWCGEHRSLSKEGGHDQA